MDMNSLTSGDIMAAMAFVIGVTVSIWGLLVASALIFRKRAEYAQHFYESAPLRTFIVGLFMGGVGNVVAIVLLNAASPIIKIVGWIILSLIAAVSIVGAAGLVNLAGTRIASMDNQSPGFGALARGAGLVVLAAMVPFLGWFAIMPVMYLICVGAGVQALVYRPVTTTQPITVAATGEAVS